MEMSQMRLRTICLALALILSACNVSVTSFPAEPAAPGQPSEPPTEIPPTPVPDTPTPTPLTINAPVVEAPALFEVHFFNEQEGWGVTESQIVRTIDGGSTWYNVTPPDVTTSGQSVATFMLDENHAWLQIPDFNNFPNNGLLYHTTDGGLTWT